MSYFPITAEDRIEMLETIGVEHFGQLFQAIPPELRNPKIELPPALSELEVQRTFQKLADQNVTSKTHLSFLGGGAYEHYIPSVVRHLISRGEFYTAYTPYQPEASQGTLQALFEYQSLICELTDLDVSNGSHYDGAAALAESVLMALHHTRRKRVLISGAVHPDYRTVTKTYLTGTGFEYQEASYRDDFSYDMKHLEAELTPEVGAVVVSSPNFFGLVEDLSPIEKLVHERGALLILVGHPLSFGFYKSPGEWNVDIACGEGQPLGIPMSAGGPWLGYITAKRSLTRRMPGRLVGLTNDQKGNRAFCLTLQAREQHIRRERASSNICTNQALCALAACIYLACLGPGGLRRIAGLNLESAYYLRDQMARLKDVTILTQGAIFNEFVVRLPRSSESVNEILFDKGIVGGLPLVHYFPERKNDMLVCATEVKSKSDLDRFVKALGEAL